MIAESPTHEDGLSIVDPQNDGIKRQVTEIEGNQKGVKFIDAKWKNFPISLNVNVIPVKKFFSLLEELTDLNFVIGDEVTGDLTMRVKNVNWIEVFDMVLREKNLIHDVNDSGTVITVHTHEFAKTQSESYEQALQSKIKVINSLSGLEAKTTAIFKLNYTKPDIVAKQLKDVIATLEAGGDDASVDQRATFVVDARTNSLIVQATPSDIKWIRTTIDSLDKPTKQVMVEVFIVEAGDTFQEALGSRVSMFNKGIRSSLSKNNELDRISISGSGGTPPTAAVVISPVAVGGVPPDPEIDILSNSLFLLRLERIPLLNILTLDPRAS
jgi:type IV pilus assembly protein PilQ